MLSNASSILRMVADFLDSLNKLIAGSQPAPLPAPTPSPTDNSGSTSTSTSGQ